MRTETMRNASQRLESTAASRACFSGSLPSAQGMVSSMYWLERAISFHTSARAEENWKCSMQVS